MILDGSNPQAISRVAAALAAGALVGLPTETVYGLAANATNDLAVRQIYAMKGRPAGHPLIVHVSGQADVVDFTTHMPPFAQRLMDAFWPGPLTVILPRRPGVAATAAGQQPTIGLRAPAHPVAQALLQACRTQGISGLAAPSANRFGGVSPTTAQHVVSEFGAALLVLDGGPCRVGIESAIVDCTRSAPVLLRPGRLTRAELSRAAGCLVQAPGTQLTPDPRASGTLTAHYAPQAKLRLMPAEQLHAALQVVGASAAQHIGVWARGPASRWRQAGQWRAMPEDAASAGQQLFATLRDFDATGVRLIWVETPPTDEVWDGVRDRLQRAAASG